MVAMAGTPDSMRQRPVRVLVIDDSALVRKLMSELLACDPGIEVVGTAADPFIVIKTIGLVNRDVIEDNLESALSANEIAALNGAPSRIVLTLT